MFLSLEQRRCDDAAEANLKPGRIDYKESKKLWNVVCGCRRSFLQLQLAKPCNKYQIWFAGEEETNLRCSIWASPQKLGQVAADFLIEKFVAEFRKHWNKICKCFARALPLYESESSSLLSSASTKAGSPLPGQSPTMVCVKAWSITCILQLAAKLWVKGDKFHWSLMHDKYTQSMCLSWHRLE